MNPFHGGHESSAESLEAGHVKLVGSISDSLTAFKDLHDDRV